MQETSNQRIKLRAKIKELIAKIRSKQRELGDLRAKIRDKNRELRDLRGQLSQVSKVSKLSYGAMLRIQAKRAKPSQQRGKEAS